MKIDKSCIDHNANRLVNEIVLYMWDNLKNENREEVALVNLAYIRGVMDMAEAMKKVLDAQEGKE